jgi:hypothetical protein
MLQLSLQQNSAEEHVAVPQGVDGDIAQTP